MMFRSHFIKCPPATAGVALHKKIARESDYSFSFHFQSEKHIQLMFTSASI